MKFPRFIFTLLFGMSLLFMSLQAACSGGSITATESTTYTCKVKMESRRGMDRTLPRSYKFDVEIELECLSKGKHCYQITYLSCQGEVKSNAIPINLLKAGDCPGGPYCLSKCSNASRSMWDIPSLLAIDGCNVYKYQTELKVGG